MAFRPHLEVGYVSRAHGLTGEVAVKTFDPASEALFDVERALLRLRGTNEELELTIDSIRSTPKELLIGFEGIEGRTASERLVGATVFAFREDLEPPAEGEFFQGDLIGLEVFDEEGARLGRVEEIWETGPVPNLVIRAEGKEEMVVPFADEFVPTVDLDQRRLVVRLPEYEE